MSARVLRAGVALAALLVCAWGSARAQSPAQPRAAADGVVWESAVAPDTTGRANALEYWRARAASGEPAFVLRSAIASLAAGDTLGADSLLAQRALTRSPWSWEALRTRAECALAHADTARAETLLAGADREGWPDSERAAWLVARARVRAARRDTSGALLFARQVIEAYPGTGVAGAALSLLERIRAARADSLSRLDERRAVEVELLRADRVAAATRLKRLFASAPVRERGALAQRLAEVQRSARRPLEARLWADSARKLAPDAAARARAELELARTLRDAGRTDSALALYGRLERGAGELELRVAAAWEYARECEDRSRWSEALAAFDRCSALGGSRANDARLRAGLDAWVLGARDTALARWRAVPGEAAEFWRAVATRANDRTRGDSLLRVLAVRPGYAFYRACARESLGTRGWPGAVAMPTPSESSAVLARATRLVAADPVGDDAMTYLSRWFANDARVHAPRPDAGTALAAARLAYGCGRMALGTLWVDRAMTLAGTRDSLQWAYVPWAYPPAFAALVQAVTVDSLGLDAPLLWGLMRQESRFDPRARSKSNALGLTQLKREAAGDMAKLLRDPVPSESTLFVPANAVRYGARYLASMLKRFDARVPVALAAYNAGPGAVRKDYADLIARGGEALYCEFASNADSQEYARRIMGFRQAYRELRPRGQ